MHDELSGTGEAALTGASGKTGLAVLKALRSRGIRVRALIRRAEAEPLVRARGAVDVRVVSLADADDVAAALSGCRAVYHIPPNMHPAEDQLSRAVIAAAVRAGVPRFVLHSVLAPYAPAMPHHLRKARAEAALRETTLAWTILQPASYMQNLLPMLDRADPDGAVAVPYSVHAAFTPVDLADVAEAAASVIADDGHTWATYEMAGPHVMDSATMLAEASTILGRPLRAVRQDLDVWRQAARRGGSSDQLVDDLAAMFAYYDSHGLVGNPGVARMLLGREPTDLRAAIARDLALRLPWFGGA